MDNPILFVSICMGKYIRNTKIKGYNIGPDTVANIFFIFSPIPYERTNVLLTTKSPGLVYDTKVPKNNCDTGPCGSN